MDVVRFGGDVRLLRTRRGWTQRRLATEAKVSRWVVAEIEASSGDRLTAERLIRVVAALGRLSLDPDPVPGRRARSTARSTTRGLGRPTRGAAPKRGMGRRDRGLVQRSSASAGSIDVLAFEPTTGRTARRSRSKTVRPGHRRRCSHARPEGAPRSDCDTAADGCSLVSRLLSHCLDGRWRVGASRSTRRRLAHRRFDATLAHYALRSRWRCRGCERHRVARLPASRQFDSASALSATSPRRPSASTRR